MRWYYFDLTNRNSSFIISYSLMQLVLSGARQTTLAPLSHSSSSFLRVAACGICHSDRKAYHCPPSGMKFPRVLGHEVCGTLSVDLPGQQLVQGDRVVLWPALVCGKCHFCLSNRKNLCEQIQLFGYHVDGGFGHELTVPINCLPKLKILKIPKQVSFLQATFAEPVGCVINGLQKLAGAPRTLLIFGAGVMGRLCSRVARILWPSVDVCLSDVNQHRWRAAKADGGIGSLKQADLVFIAASNSLAFEEGLKMLNPGGTVVLFSGFAKAEREICLDHNELHRQEQSLRGAYGCLPADMQLALNLIADGGLIVDDLITNEITLDQTAVELERAVSFDDYKTIINIKL